MLTSLLITTAGLMDVESVLTRLRIVAKVVAEVVAEVSLSMAVIALIHSLT